MFCCNFQKILDLRIPPLSSDVSLVPAYTTPWKTLVIELVLLVVTSVCILIEIGFLLE